ncbi:hypothetical protein CWI38_0510p0010 [Hamiltosporidium tvaerminnensis]|uniref:Uncharacterized protein n=1 Tax=Hamiltosporidium tvaerminnensis TaxID=1176355 RepID=A0A4Q9LWW3_9MICR|nr:hypothetical protein CWI38_0510p0010 [Hamiltosporidium tvaerminnensis]
MKCKSTNTYSIQSIILKKTVEIIFFSKVEKKFIETNTRESLNIPTNTSCKARLLNTRNILPHKFNGVTTMEKPTINQNEASDFEEEN